MAALEHLEIRNGWGIYRPRGQFSLVDAVDLVTRAIAHCRESEANKLLVDATGFIDLPIPTLLDRFLMVDDWAQEAKSVVVVAMVASPEYIHPRKFGVNVALQFGLICDVYSSEEDASAWLTETASHVK
jgi:hypothetical protein